MPRQGRINIEGGIYHVIQRGLERREIFRDDFDREEFLRRLADALRETNHKCYYIPHPYKAFPDVAIGRYLGITGTAVSKGIKEGEKIVEENNLKFIS